MKPLTEPLFITEDYLKAHFGLRYGGEIILPPGTRFTPSARQLLQERSIGIRWQDPKGQHFVSQGDELTDAGHLKQVHALKSDNQRPQNRCQLCESEVAEKPALLTHLDDSHLVPKTHPRIALRGKLDSCISYCVLVQCAMEAQPDKLRSFMADIRSYLGDVLQAEVLNRPLPLPGLGEFDAQTLHRWSHNPMKHLGHDHMLPDAKYGLVVGQLNYLRGLIRELELQATSVFLDDTLKLSPLGEDIVAGLNRLSSAVYVVMQLVWQCQIGNQSLLEELSRGAS